MIQDGDNGFTGVNMRQTPGLLPPGVVSYAENCRFDRGSIRPRRGIKILPWTNRVEAGGIFPVEPVLGAGTFHDPDDRDWLIVATQNEVYYISENNGAREMILPDGETVTGPVTFTQAFDRIFMFRGEGQEPLVCNNVGTGWTLASDEFTASEDDDGTEQIPNSASALYTGNRLFIPVGDNVYVSDFLSYTRFSLPNQFRVNTGSNDELVSLHKYDEDTIIAFKERSIYRVTGISSLATARLDEVTRAHGCAAAGSVVSVGQDVFFLSRDGVRALSVSEQGELRGVDIPLSEPIQPVMDEVDWPNASKAKGIYHRNKYYLALPLRSRPKPFLPDTTNIGSQSDGELTTSSGDTLFSTTELTERTANNAVIVYDMLTRQWCGFDTGPELNVADWFLAKMGGSDRLFFVSNGGYICLYDDELYSDWTDDKAQVSGGSYTGKIENQPIKTDLMTRAYRGQTVSSKRFHRVDLLHSSLAPNFRVSIVTDGENEVEVVQDWKTRDRTKYSKPFDAPAYKPGNADRNYNIPHREDYALRLDELPTDEDVAGFPDAEFPLQSGDDDFVRLDREQHFDDRYRTRARGVDMLVRVENTDGLLAINAVKVAGVDVNANATREIS
jgi:hypothetical protein